MNIHSTRRGGRRLLLCLLAVSAASIAIGTAQVQAATAEEDAGAIIVTGTRPIAESEASALEVQKQSDSLVTVAASDSVGRLPDQNIAQARSEERRGGQECVSTCRARGAPEQ